MFPTYATWNASAPITPSGLREARSGLSGLGDRPALHPAWREPEAEVEGFVPAPR